MTEPATIIGYIKLIKKIDNFTLYDKKGYDSLPDDVKYELQELSGAISNHIRGMKISNNKVTMK